MIEKRICTKCNIEKPLTSEFFAKAVYRKCGLTNSCKVCRAAGFKKWKIENEEKYIEVKEKSRLKHKENYKTPEYQLKSYNLQDNPELATINPEHPQIQYYSIKNDFLEII